MHGEGKPASPSVSKVLESIPGVKAVYRTRELEEQQAKREGDCLIDKGSDSSSINKQLSRFPRGTTFHRLIRIRLRLLGPGIYSSKQLVERELQLVEQHAEERVELELQLVEQRVPRAEERVERDLELVEQRAEEGAERDLQVVEQDLQVVEQREVRAEQREVRAEQREVRAEGREVREGRAEVRAEQLEVREDQRECIKRLHGHSAIGYTCVHVHKFKLRAEHLGLHKAMCVLLEWKSGVAPDVSTWVPEHIPCKEAMAQKEVIILCRFLPSTDLVLGSPPLPPLTTTNQLPPLSAQTTSVASANYQVLKVLSREVKRVTKETNAAMRINLDGSGIADALGSFC
ncbi:hypothetical protein RHSIM_Rhsim01G0010900 [Rhododendron simsii]|uniref:Uncharacterized protein n=1 Tax=Rhododendron simsii TaxID=118357 RepID=A0A834M2I0_RHOSS|nr:hypothetical protein RHSIM_Rhsim01G0010900 [Rhododendron simsii]